MFLYSAVSQHWFVFYPLNLYGKQSLSIHIFHYSFKSSYHKF